MFPRTYVLRSERRKKGSMEGELQQHEQVPAENHEPASWHQGVTHDVVIHLIQQYLAERNFSTALAALEQESRIEFCTTNIPRSGELMRIITEYNELQLAAQEPQEEKELLDQLLVAGNGAHLQGEIKVFGGIHNLSILCVRFSPNEDATMLATASADKTVKLTNYSTGETVSTLKCHSGGVLALDFNPMTPNLLLTGAMDATHTVVDINTSTVVQKFTDHQKYVVRTCWHPSGLLFATGSYDRTVCIYNSSGGIFELQKRFHFVGNVEALKFTLDGKTLLVAVRNDNYLHCIDIDTLQDTRLNMNANGDDHVSFTAMDIALDDDGNYLSIATDRDRLIMYRLGTERQVRNFYGSTNDVYSHPRSVFDHSGKYLYASSQDHSIQVYDIASERVIHKLTGHNNVVRDLHLHRRENLLATCSYDKTIRLWASELR